jgi:hypothetical protein
MILSSACLKMAKGYDGDYRRTGGSSRSLETASIENLEAKNVDNQVLIMHCIKILERGIQYAAPDGTRGVCSLSVI